jgi:hypothetical protein
VCVSKAGAVEIRAPQVGVAEPNTLQVQVVKMKVTAFAVPACGSVGHGVDRNLYLGLGLALNRRTRIDRWRTGR